jgi:hypothetical protein
MIAESYGQLTESSDNDRYLTVRLNGGLDGT